MTGKVYNKHHRNAPVDAVYIGRGSPYGNPFVIGKDGTRDDVCDKYEDMVMANPHYIRTVKQNLKGKSLVCFCKPARCHGDFLSRLANEQ